MNKKTGLALSVVSLLALAGCGDKTKEDATPTTQEVIVIEHQAPEETTRDAKELVESSEETPVLVIEAQEEAPMVEDETK